VEKQASTVNKTAIAAGPVLAAVIHQLQFFVLHSKNVFSRKGNVSGLMSRKFTRRVAANGLAAIAGADLKVRNSF
jgi:hypothetical protein